MILYKSSGDYDKKKTYAVGDIFTLECAKPEKPQEDVNSEIRKWADIYYSLWCFVENSLPKGEIGRAHV